MNIFYTYRQHGVLLSCPVTCSSVVWSSLAFCVAAMGSHSWASALEALPWRSVVLVAEWSWSAAAVSEGRPADERYLDFEAGELFIAVTMDEGWCLAQRAGSPDRGWVPPAYFREIKRVSASPSPPPPPPPLPPPPPATPVQTPPPPPSYESAPAGSQFAGFETLARRTLPDLQERLQTIEVCLGVEIKLQELNCKRQTMAWAIRQARQEKTLTPSEVAWADKMKLARDKAVHKFP